MELEFNCRRDLAPQVGIGIGIELQKRNWLPFWLCSTVSVDAVRTVLPSYYPRITLVLPSYYPRITLVLPACYHQVLPGGLQAAPVARRRTAVHHVSPDGGAARHGAAPAAGGAVRRRPARRRAARRRPEVQPGPAPQPSPVRSQVSAARAADVVGVWEGVEMGRGCRRRWVGVVAGDGLVDPVFLGYIVTDLLFSPRQSLDVDDSSSNCSNRY